MTQFHLRGGAALNETDNARVNIGKAGKSGFLTKAENCPRCGGQGGSPHWRPDGGVCYQCRGRRTVTVTRRVFTEDKLNVLNIAAQKKADKLTAKQDEAKRAERSRFIIWAKVAPRGKLIGTILTGKGNFFESLASQIRSHKLLSDKQMDAVARIVEQNTTRAAQDGTSAYVGEIKDRIEFEATVEFTKEIEGYYGTTTIIKLRDLEGNVFTWFASGWHDVGRGDRVSIKGTVKKHDEYQGTKQTVLSRCIIKKFEVMEADEAAAQECIA